MAKPAVLKTAEAERLSGFESQAPRQFEPEKPVLRSTVTSEVEMPASRPKGRDEVAWWATTDVPILGFYIPVLGSRCRFLTS